jgi:hypothetical protein
VLLNLQRQCLIGLAEQVRAQHIVPRLKQDRVGEDARRLVSQLGYGRSLGLGIEVVVEDLLRSCGVAVLTLFTIVNFAQFSSAKRPDSTYFEFHPRQKLTT